MMNERRPVALLTGGGSGIGRALADRLAADGYAIHLVGRNRARLESIAGGNATIHTLDLTDDSAIEGLVQTLSVTVGQIDVLVHSAGDVALGKIAEAPVEDLDRQYKINLRTPVLLTQKLLPLIRTAKGQVVFINSGAGQSARPSWGHYAMTKHGLRALADSLREEVASDGIRVLSVYPGRTATPMQEEVHRLEGKAYDPKNFLAPEDVALQITTAIALPARAMVTEITIRPTGH